MPGSSAAFAKFAAPAHALCVEPYPTVFLVVSGPATDAITAVAESLLAHGFDATLFDPSTDDRAQAELCISVAPGPRGFAGATLHFDLDRWEPRAVTSAILEHLLGSGDDVNVDEPAANTPTASSESAPPPPSPTPQAPSDWAAAATESDGWDMIANGPALEHEHAQPRRGSLAWLGWVAAFVVVAAGPVAWMLLRVERPSVASVASTPPGNAAIEPKATVRPPSEPPPVVRAVLEDEAAKPAVEAVRSAPAAPSAPEAPALGADGAVDPPSAPTPAVAPEEDAIVLADDRPASTSAPRRSTSKRAAAPDKADPTAPADVVPLVVPAPPPLGSDPPPDASERLPDVLDDSDPTAATPAPGTPFLPLPDKGEPSIPESGNPLSEAEADPPSTSP